MPRPLVRQCFRKRFMYRLASSGLTTPPCLPSADITRHRRYYDPVRLPPASPSETASRARPSCLGGSPSYPRHPSGVPCPLPRWTAAGASVGCFPATCSLPRNSGGSASTTSLSRPAQASLALRPVGSLNRPRRPLSRGFDPPGRPDRPLVSYQINRQLSGWNLPPRVARAIWAHSSPARVGRGPRGRRPRQR